MKRTPPRLRPQLETLESVTLLSGASAAVGAVAAVAQAATVHKLNLAGTARGSYREVIKNPDTGATFTFVGSGTVTPLGRANLVASIQSPGNIANGHSKGTLVLSTASGSVTLTLIGPAQNGSTPVPDTFSFTITKATGKFKGDTGTGYLALALDPTATSHSTAAPFVTRGSFSMVFVTVPPPSTTA